MGRGCAYCAGAGAAHFFQAALPALMLLCFVHPVCCGHVDAFKCASLEEQAQAVPGTAQLLLLHSSASLF